MNREALIEKMAEALHYDVYPADKYPWSTECPGAKDHQRMKARVALTAITEAGMAVVPLEPSVEEMKAASQAFRLAWWDADNNSKRDAYQAMVTAAEIKS